MTPFLQFISTVFGQATLLAAAAWLIKKLVSNSMARDADAFRAQLQLNEAEFRNRLEIEAHRQNTVFSSLHTRRGETIAEVYALLSEAVATVATMVAPFQPAGDPDPKTKANSSAEAIRKLGARFSAARIWFSEETAQKMDSVMTELRGVHNDFNIVAMRSHRQGEAPDADAWMKSFERVEKKVPELKAALEKDFRTLLGVE